MDVPGLEIAGGWTVVRDVGGVRLLRGTDGSGVHLALTHAADLPFPEVREWLLRHAVLLKAVHGETAVHVTDRPTRTAVRMAAHVDAVPLEMATSECSLADLTSILAELCDAVARVHCAGWTLGELRAEEIVVADGRPRLMAIPDSVEGVDPRADQRVLAELCWTLASARGPVPASLAAVLHTAMDPDVDHRYPSVLGLRQDLRAGSRTGWPDTAAPAWLGHHGELMAWKPSGRLFGRDDALAALDAAVDDVHIAGAPRVVVVRGQSGAGRSALLDVWCDRLADRGVIGAVSRFSAAGDDPPLAAPLDALDQLVDRLMVADADVVESVAASLRDTLHEDASLACAVAPPLRRLLPDAPLDDGDVLLPARVTAAATKVITALTAVIDPVVLAFDDAEHADPTSHGALALLASADAGPLLVVLAVREGDPAGGLDNVLAKLTDQGVSVDVVHLAGLPADQVRLLVADGAGLTEPTLDAVADAAHARTGGVPGAVVADVEGFIRSGLMGFDAAALQWRWDAAVITAGTESSLAELAVQRIEVLPAEIRATASAVAVAGRLATSEVLSLALGQPIDTTVNHLRHATELAVLAAPGRRNRWFTFNDDSVRRAALASIDSMSMSVPELRRRIAEAALTLAPRDESGRPQPVAEHLFEILALLAGTDATLGRVAAEQRLEHCLRAARTAHRAGAFVVALDLQLRAIALVDRAGWTNDADRRFELHVRAAHHALAVGRTELADRLLATAWELDPSAVQKVRAMAVLGTRWWTRGDHQVGLSEVRSMLDELGFGLPERIRVRHLATELTRTRVALRRRQPESFLDGPRMADERAIAALDAMVGAVHLAYVSEPLTHALMVMRGVRLTAKRGVCPSSAYFIAGYGLLLCSTGRQIDRGLRFGRVGVQLAERTGGSMRAMVGFAYHGFVSHWGTPIDDTVQPLLEEYRRGSAEGRGGFAHTGATFAVLHAMLAYRPLAEVAGLADELITTFERLGETAFSQRSAVVRQAAADLATGPGVLNGTWFDVTRWEADPARPRRGELAAVVHTVRSLVALLVGDPATASDAVGRAAAQIRTAPGEAVVAVHRFHAALLAADATVVAGAGMRRRARRAARRRLAQLRRVTPQADEGLGAARLQVVLALVAQSTGDDGQAALHFDRAHQLAMTAGAFGEIALVAERAARLHDGRGGRGLADYYLSCAYRALVAWGASVAAEALSERWPGRIDVPLAAAAGQPPTVRSGPAPLDSDALADAGRLLAQPVEVHTFLDRMIEIIVRHANASRGFLLMTNEGRLTVEAAAGQRDGAVRPIPLDGGAAGSPLLCWPAVRYVARTQEPLALTDPADDRRLRADAGLRQRAPRAMLSLPLGIGVGGGGVLVLESDHFSRAFEESRVEAIRMLATQAVTAIAAARLSSDLGVLGRDVAGLRELAADLTVKAESDPLTGLANRRGLESRLGELVAVSGRPDQTTSLAVAYVDLDGFKRINDTVGHAAGDVVLATAAARLRGVTRDRDLVARIGGDEFVVIASGVSESELRSLSSRILEQINAPVRLPSGEIATVSASIGLHFGDRIDGWTIDDIEAGIAAADAAMLQAKRAGKNQVAG
jgi:diguanylate cyclase (GGDEF)-like protein